MPNFMLGKNEGPQLVAAGGFTPASNYVNRIAFVDAADSKSGIFSAWIRMIVDAEQDQKVMNAGVAVIMKVSYPTFQFEINLLNSGESAVLTMRTESALALDTWYHILASWDMAVPDAAHLLVNGVPDKTVTVFNDDTIDYTHDLWILGQYLYGYIAEPYFAPGQYLDLSVEANVKKFRGSDGKPMNLGSDGSFPTGTAPISYQHLNPGDNITDFGINRGTGGIWTITGTLTAAPTSPSD